LVPLAPLAVPAGECDLVPVKSPLLDGEADVVRDSEPVALIEGGGGGLVAVAYCVASDGRDEGDAKEAEATALAGAEAEGKLAEGDALVAGESESAGEVL